MSIFSNVYTFENKLKVRFLYTGNNRFSGLQEPDRFFRYIRRLLYYYISKILAFLSWFRWNLAIRIVTTLYKLKDDNLGLYFIILSI